MQDVLTQAKEAQKAANTMRLVSTQAKNDFLNVLADLLEKEREQILVENQKDITAGKDLTAAMKRRLVLGNDFWHFFK